MVGPCGDGLAARYFHALRCERRVECCNDPCRRQPFDEYLKQDNLTAADPYAVGPYGSYLAQQNSVRSTVAAGNAPADESGAGQPAAARGGSLRLTESGREPERSVGFGGPRIGEIPVVQREPEVQPRAVVAYRVTKEIRGRSLIDVVA